MFFSNKIFESSRSKYLGYCVVIGYFLFLLALFTKLETLYSVSALCYWVVFIFSWSRLSFRNKNQIKLLMGGGGLQ